MSSQQRNPTKRMAHVLRDAQRLATQACMTALLNANTAIKLHADGKERGEKVLSLVLHAIQKASDVGRGDVWFDGNVPRGLVLHLESEGFEIERGYNNSRFCVKW